MIGKRKINRIINTRVKKTSWYWSIWNGAEKFWQNPPFDLDVVNLGSGGALHAYNYDGLPIKGSNWALWPQSLVHDYNILKNYFSFINDGGVVIISVCPFGFLVNPNYTMESNLKYYTFLHPSTIINFDEQERQKALLLRDSPFSIKPRRCIKELFRYYVKKCFSKHKMSECNTTDFALSAQNLVNSWKQQFGIVNLEAPLSKKHYQEFISRKKTLFEIIEFCKDRGLHPVVVYPPLHPELRKLFPKSFENLICSFVENDDSYGHIFFNYANCPEISADEYFMTAYFLNRKGAKVFTKKLLRDLNLIND